MGTYAKRAAELLIKADIVIKGERPWDMKVKGDPEALFRKVFNGGSLAFCEAFMDGEWDCVNLFELLCRIFQARLDREVRGFADLMLVLRAKLSNAQSLRRSLRVARDHYDLGNDFYELWLDKSMNYSSAIWASGVKNIDEAQLQKMDHIAKKMKLEAGMRVLDVGCGWGALAEYLIKMYRVKVVGLTLAKEQAKKARERCKGLSGAEFLVEDYRNHKGAYDRIVSVGMIEHVGVGNHPVYFDKAYQMLDPGDSGALFLCHGIVGQPYAKNAFLNKYIFPGGELGAIWQIAKTSEEAGFKVEDFENFGFGYCKTLLAWAERFNANWEKIVPLIGDDILRVFGTVERFRRGWNMYLIGDAAKFHVRDVSVGQYVLSKNWIGKRYESVRL